mgnify:CR=1 FL=1
MSLDNIKNINLLYDYAMDNSEYVMIKEMFLSALFFNTSAAMALKKIRIIRKTNNKDKIIIPNYFGITFAGSGCVDEETEFLTPKGWKKISEYKDGDLVCQWNEDGSTQFVNPIAYISEPEYEKCIKIKSKKVDRFICNNHRMPVINIFGKVSEIKSNKFVSFEKNILQKIKHIGFNEKTKKTFEYTIRQDNISYEYMPNFKKYCFTVPSSFWVARRNDFISIEGNCGKNHSDNIAKSLFKDMHERFDALASEFYEKRKDSDGKPDPKYLNLSSYFIPVTSTWQALQKAAQTVTDMGAGSVNVVSDELGDSIMSMTEIFTKLKSTWDTGISEGQVNVSNGGEAYFLVQDLCVNALLFGAPAPFELVPAKKDKLLEAYVSGMARRSFIYHNDKYKKSENRNYEFEKKDSKFYEELDKYIKELRFFISNTKYINYPQNIREKLLEYDAQKELERERSSSPVAEDLGSPKKIEKLLGIIATLDLEETINEEHLRFAIEFTEALDKTAEDTVEIKPAYMRIYNEIEKRAYAARTDIVKAVKDVTVKDLDSQMVLVQEHANILGNSLIKKDYDGIVKYKIEKLSSTNLDKIIISVNTNPNNTQPKGFIRHTGTFKGLYKIVNSEYRYSAGTFKDEYINDDNYMQEQNLFIIDIDNDLTIEDARKLFSQMTYLIATTRSHQKPKKQGDETITCDRFRIILPTLSTFHLDHKRYSDMYMNVLNSLGIDEADKKCRNASRWYYGNPDGEYWYNEGQLLDIRPFIPDSAEHKEATLSMNKYESSKSSAPTSIRVDAAIRWFLSNTSAGSRNDNLFLLAILLKKEIQEEDWEGWTRRANACLASPLSESDMNTIIRSVSKR